MASEVLFRTVFKIMYWTGGLKGLDWESGPFQVYIALAQSGSLSAESVRSSFLSFGGHIQFSSDEH